VVKVENGQNKHLLILKKQLGIFWENWHNIIKKEKKKKRDSKRSSLNK
jgi:hypothetical protein